jgi:hypothetical protein
MTNTPILQTRYLIKMKIDSKTLQGNLIDISLQMKGEHVPHLFYFEDLHHRQTKLHQ